MLKKSLRNIWLWRIKSNPTFLWKLDCVVPIIGEMMKITLQDERGKSNGKDFRIINK